MYVRRTLKGLSCDCVGWRQDARNLAARRALVPEDGWGIQEARVTVSDEPYHLVLLQATSSAGATATAAIAFASCHPATLGSRAAPVGDWGGYTIAASFCRRAGVPLTGEPPLHFAEELPGRSATQQATPQPGTSTREILAIDEQRILSVVQRGNIFGPQSDGHEHETVPAVWHARTAAAPSTA